MWRKTTTDYESFSIDLGAAMALISASAIAISFFLTVVAMAIRICEIKVEGE